MSASLVGSEMCIRDRDEVPRPQLRAPRRRTRWRQSLLLRQKSAFIAARSCLLYTSDAADDM
eukprot:3234092-Alexandrium_andersonii.AAC.1